MTHLMKKIGFMITGISIGVLVVAGVAQRLGARINTSSSIPVGLYWITDRPVTKGEYVIFCPPQHEVFQRALKRGYIHAGFCPGGFGYLMKKVVASAGDVVSSNASGVFVNGELLPLSQPYQADGFNRLLPFWRIHGYVLQPSELLMMTDQSRLSFDARYFGLLKQNNIQAVIRPIFIFKLPREEN
jgi:conjugative transfer signal peptidase TraF